VTTPEPTVADLKARLGVKTSETDALLDWALTVATAWVDDRVYANPDQVPGERHAEVVEAILILASRLYARRNSPEGVAGWGDLGVVRIVASDPDIESLLERHVDCTRVGIA
jgi:hypothetical protein